LNQGLVGSMVGKTLGDVGKAQKKIFWYSESAQNDIMDAKNINVLVGEN
jgi:hypothetical protein